jgi:hypothetical protein
MKAWRVLQSDGLTLRSDAAILTALEAAFEMGKSSSKRSSPSRNRTRDGIEKARKYLDETQRNVDSIVTGKEKPCIAGKS